MKKIIVFMVIFATLIAIYGINTKVTAMARTGQSFAVYDTNGILLMEKELVEESDNFITADFKLYEVVSVDYNNGSAIAVLLEDLSPTNVEFNQTTNITKSALNKTIGLYMTHNDESYEVGDGTSSIYGKGGIHDVAIQLKKELEKQSVSVLINETLHTPHNSTAYSRSKTTASTLLNQNATAIFDIHRDAGSRSSYVKNINGSDFCKVRMVIGKANANYKKNLEFALYLLNVSKEISPNLFLDIYMASGHYNQNLSNKAILFEMGTEQVEKNLVMKSTESLAKVIATTLFKASVNTDGDIVIHEQDTSNCVSNILDGNISQELQPVQTSTGIYSTLAVLVAIFSLIAYVVYLSKSKRVYPL